MASETLPGVSSPRARVHLHARRLPDLAPTRRLGATDENRPHPADPVAPAKRSTAAATKASRRTDQGGQPVRSFRSLLDHLATLTRGDIRYGTDPTLPTVPTLTTATSTQRRALELLGQPIPLTLT